MPDKTPKVLAISSGGGHWVQLLRLRPAFAGCDVTYATVRDGYRTDVSNNSKFRLIPDGNCWNKTNLIRSAFGVARLILSVKPDVIVTTGAAPGYFAVRIGKWLGARVVWLDSIANAGELSQSGKQAGSFVDLWLTQWPHLSCHGGPQFFGSVL